MHSKLDLVADRKTDHSIVDGGFRVLVVDDCRLRRESLSGFLARWAAEVDTVWNAEQLSAVFHQCDPDIVLVNMASRDAETLLRHVIALCSPTKLVVYGLAEDDEATILACAEVGAAGYHLRSESLQDLSDCIEKVLRGKPACSARVAEVLLRRVSEVARRTISKTESLLTSREEEVLKMLAMGLSNREIAARLFIAVHTVKNHVHNVLTKIGARSRTEAVVMYTGALGATG